MILNDFYKFFLVVDWGRLVDFHVFWLVTFVPKFATQIVYVKFVVDMFKSNKNMLLSLTPPFCLV